MALSDHLKALLGISAYQPSKKYGWELDDPTVERVREALGGNIQPLPTTQIRWYWADVETAVHAADSGDVSPAARLYRAMRQDGVFAGLLAQRTSGLVRLPRRFYGREDIIEALEAKNGTRSVFDEMFPPSEIALMAADGVILGVAVGELVPVEGRDYPVLVRLDPEFLFYRWVEGRWYYRSVAGLLPITPGDGRWVLHVPGGRMQPWNSGLWSACGRAFVAKTHAILHRMNYSAKLANPARVAKAPAGATEPQRAGFLRQIIAWGLNSVFELPPGWDVALVESNGRGFEVFQSEIDSSDREFMIALAGQIVTTTGGTGFANADIHKSIRADLIKDTGDALAYTLNTQGIPQWVVRRFGEDALQDSTVVEWDTAPPKDLKIEADSLTASAGAIRDLSAALTPHERQLDIDRITSRFGIPAIAVEHEETEVERVKIDLAPADIAKVVRVDEARVSQGLPPIGDERGALTIDELESGVSDTPGGGEDELRMPTAAE